MDLIPETIEIDLKKDRMVFARVSKPLKEAVIKRVKTGIFKDQSAYILQLIIRDLQDNKIID